MANETTKAKARLATLVASLDELENDIDPLFSQTLPETLVALEPIQQAKLQTLLPYMIYDLVFIYLKSRGIDPKTHPVISELDRIRQYFEKLKNAEHPPKRTTAVDKEVAARFITHAINQVDLNLLKASPSQAIPGPSSERVPVKVTSKMKERAEYEKALKEGGESGESEEELEIIDEDEPSLNENKGKGKQREIEETPIDTGKKRRRPVMDPFAASGFGDDEDNSAQTKKIKKDTDTNSSADTSTPDADPSIVKAKAAKKQRKSKNSQGTEGSPESTIPPQKKLSRKDRRAQKNADKS